MSKMENKKKIGRKKRGEINKADLTPYLNFSTTQLIEMLESPEAQKRTIAAMMLGDKREKEVIEPLCYSLKIEKALYSRIAISEALGKMGESAVVPVADLLGQIGNNQEIELPKKYFNKKSYPLVRDMAARTLVKIGKPATTYLIQLLESEKDIFIKQQAIDALGSIASKTGDYRSLKPIINCFDNIAGINQEDINLSDENMDKVTLWKIIRSLSAFKNSKEAVGCIILVLNNFPDPQLQWESARSLGQIGVSSPEVLEILSKMEESDDIEIKKAAKNAMISLEKDL
ncbi:MAG: HEAT repeat domain-containing protein [Methanobacteriaceae archaeon]|nr:HEAT repeat domain-containing protein [Methanobacteriaceae archaeon]